MADGIGELLALDWSFQDSETAYLTHGLHPYPAKFIPQIPKALIRSLSKPGEIVADIFCGSGTTLVEALIEGRHAVGVDASELACVISRAKTARLTRDDFQHLSQLNRRATELLLKFDKDQPTLFANDVPIINKDSAIPDPIRFWFEPHVIEELAAIQALFPHFPDHIRLIAQTCFASIIVAVSRQDSDTRYVRRDKDIRPGDSVRRFLRALRDAVVALKELSRIVDPRLLCKVVHADILSGPDIGEVDLIVSSPPYPNAYSYHLYHMTRMLWLGLDQPTFKRNEIGSHRKYSKNGPNGANAETFRQELLFIFRWIRKHLKQNGHVCFVIGNSIIKGELVRNDELLIDAASDCAFTLVARTTRRLQDNKKAFNPKIGKIKEEHIVILKNGCES